MPAAPKHPRPALPGARKAELRSYIEPCDPTLRDKAPEGDEWVYEVKADGYRIQLHVWDRAVRVFSRMGVDWTGQFSSVTDAAARLAARRCIIDGEVVAYGEAGRPDYEVLRRELNKSRGARLVYHAFDLLFLDGYDLRDVPYLQRKRALKEIVAEAGPTILYVDFLEAEGARAFEHACRIGLEGLVAKRRDSVYRSGRVESWIKLKCIRSDDFPIVAFVEKLGADPRRIASLYIGRREGGRLSYAGKVRTGWSDAEARDLRERLDPLIEAESPLSTPIRKPKATWVRPVIEAEISHHGITENGIVRESIFKGLRDDLVPSQPASRKTGGVPRENILQLLPDAVAPSKEALAAYWRRVGTRALHFLGRRPLKLVRHTRHTVFYHMGKLPPIPPAVHQLRIEKREGGEGVRVWVDDVEGLLGLVEMDA